MTSTSDTDSARGLADRSRPRCGSRRSGPAVSTGRGAPAFSNNQRGVRYGSRGPRRSVIGRTLRPLLRLLATDLRWRRGGQSGEAVHSTRPVLLSRRSTPT